MDASGSSHILTAQEHSAFDRDGYLIIDSGIAPDVLNGVVGDLRTKFTAPDRSIEGVFYSLGRIQDAWKISQNVRDIALAPAVLNVLKQLYERRPMPFQTLNFPVGTQQPAHSDTIHFDSIPSGYMCGVWVALEDIDMEMGPLMYYPGSHKLPDVGVEDLHPLMRFMVTPYYERFAKSLRSWGLMVRATPLENTHQAIYIARYEPFVSRLIARHRLNPSYGTIKKGKALIWAANLLHGGSYQQDKSRSRYSQVTHYFFESCNYHTPLLQRRTHSFRKQSIWRYPQEIV
jgi:ectoine hydroxylase-related dioxygenase (phytanoyl-CoA dioxygenase family)